jgi:hypothetical protein
MELVLIYLFISLIVAIIILSRMKFELKNYKLMMVASVLIISMILLSIGNAIGLAIMSIIAMILFFYFVYN